MRPDWDTYFLSIVYLTRLRSNCIKRKVGSLVVKDRVIVGLGYNGTPTNTINCFDGGCNRCCSQSQDGFIETCGKRRKLDVSFRGVDLDKCVCLHAELNAILASNTNLQGSTLYSTLEPCLDCAKVITQCGITRVVYINEYLNNTIIDNLYKSAGILVEQCEMTMDMIRDLDLDQ